MRSEKNEQPKRRKSCGKGWIQFTEKGIFINIRVSVEDIAEMPLDAHGNYCLTIAPMLIKESGTHATHQVYEDAYMRKERKK